MSAMTQELLSTHHADKWRILRGLKDTAGRNVLDAFTKETAPEAQAAAVNVIFQALEKNNQALPQEIMHAAAQGLVGVAISDRNNTGVDRLLVAAFKKAINHGTADRRGSVLEAVFDRAVDTKNSDVESAAIALFEKLKVLDEGKAEDIIGRRIPGWSAQTSVALAVQRARFDLNA